MEHVKRDYRRAKLPRKTRAILDYAVKLTRTPGAMKKADVDELREAGWDDQAIHDAAQVTAAFNYYNRLADGLGIDLEPEMSRNGDTTEAPLRNRPTQPITRPINTGRASRRATQEAGIPRKKAK